MGDLLLYLENNRDYLLSLTVEHLGIVVEAVAVSTVIGVILGLACTRWRGLAAPTLAVASVILTIPSFALIGLMALPQLFGYTNDATVAALVLYSLLPITRNTYVGLSGVDPAVLESARGMGMSQAQVLRRVQLPLAAPVILAGIRQATVLNVAMATIGAAIASGGLGTPIFEGISNSRIQEIVGATIPVALLGIAADLLLGVVERALRDRYLSRLRLRVTWRPAAA